jgi:hypothetical protein
LWQLDFLGHQPLWRGRVHALRVLDDHARYAMGLLVTVTFDAAHEQVIVRDEHEVMLAAVTLPWLTEGWLWADVPLPDQTPHPSVTSTRP